MTGLIFRRDTSTVHAICTHLERCSASFTPPLAERVDLADYAGRLFASAVRFEAWDGSRLVALVAVYCNAPDRKVAFVSNVSVDTLYTRRGIARRLMEAAVSHTRGLWFDRLALEVDAGAASALALYRALGFVKLEESGRILTMHLDLRKETA